MSLVRINWKPNAAELRKFGAVILAGFAVIGGILKWRNHDAAAEWCFWIGGVAGSVGLTGLVIALPFYWIWMGFAFVMGNVMSRLILTLFYYLMITPMGLVMRLSGRDKLVLKAQRSRTSHWVDVDTDRSSDYERQF